jgi:single-strand DNA-binding protein
VRRREKLLSPCKTRPKIAPQKEAPRNFAAFLPIYFEKKKSNKTPAVLCRRRAANFWQRNFLIFFCRAEVPTHGGLFCTVATMLTQSRAGINKATKEASMSGSLNKATLIGNLGKQPEIRSFQNGGRAANLTIATSESWKDKATGERKERTEWHRVTIMSEGLVTVAEKYLNKGDKVYIEGKLETRKWTDNEGKERYTTEIVLRPYSGELLMLESRRDEPEVSARADDEVTAQPAVPAVEEVEEEQPVKAKKARAGK